MVSSLRGCQASRLLPNSTASMPHLSTKRLQTGKGTNMGEVNFTHLNENWRQRLEKEKVAAQVRVLDPQSCQNAAGQAARCHASNALFIEPLACTMIRMSDRHANVALPSPLEPSDCARVLSLLSTFYQLWSAFMITRSWPAHWGAGHDRRPRGAEL